MLGAAFMLRPLSGTVFALAGMLSLGWLTGPVGDWLVWCHHELGWSPWTWMTIGFEEYCWEQSPPSNPDCESYVRSRLFHQSWLGLPTLACTVLLGHPKSNFGGAQVLVKPPWNRRSWLVIGLLIPPVVAAWGRSPSGCCRSGGLRTRSGSRPSRRLALRRVAWLSGTERKWVGVVGPTLLPPSLCCAVGSGSIIRSPTPKQSPHSGYYPPSSPNNSCGKRVGGMSRSDARGGPDRRGTGGRQRPNAPRVTTAGKAGGTEALAERGGQPVA